MARLIFFDFLSSNDTTRHPDDTGQLVNYHSSNTLSTAPSSQKYAFQAPIFRLVQWLVVLLYHLEAYFWDPFFIFFHKFVRLFHTSGIELRDISQFRPRSARANACENRKKLSHK